MLEAVPEARLEIAGDGDHRPVLEREIDERGLHDRVTLHGFVEEDEKAELYGRAWVSLTASSAEGWCLTVMEAAACGTPSAALRVGGLAESIVDEQTGVLAETPEELAAKVRDLVARPRAARAAAARPRRPAPAASRGTARRRRTSPCSSAPPRSPPRRSSTGLQPLGDREGRRHGDRDARAPTRSPSSSRSSSRACSASATTAPSARSLSTFTILAVAGSALQVAVARETALGRLGDRAEVGATIRRWSAPARWRRSWRSRPRR